jgi:hypothetical protein
MTTIKCRMTDCKNNIDGFCGKQFLVIAKFKTCIDYQKKPEQKEQKEKNWKDIISDLLFEEDTNPQHK